ncbi:hypothetical protein VTI28DRAFT_6796 [Corynascus sepedonium]
MSQPHPAPLHQQNLANLKSVFTESPAPPSRPRFTGPITPDYTSNPVTIPPTFLTTAPPDARPPTASRINFAASPLPEYAGLYAVVLDHVLSPSECAALLALAEASVPTVGAEEGDKDDGGSGSGRNKTLLRNGPNDPWGPALVNVGGGREVLWDSYRNGDRIVWDHQEVVNRIWARCLSAAEEAGGDDGDAVRERFDKIGVGEEEIVGGMWEGWAAGRWEFLRVNDRMRFLRYGKGGFFKPHCDAPFVDTRDPSRNIQTMFTIHLYLNDSKAEVEGAELVGGATTFFSRDRRRRIDVNPKAGRVLIFQHKGLIHSGDDVLRGTKYTMRTDIIYELKLPETTQEEVVG